jgi:MSHA biogenesis protein MshL
MKLYKKIAKMSVLMVSVLLLACSSYVEPNAGQPAITEMHQALQQAYANDKLIAKKVDRVEVPKAISQALLPALSVERPGQTPESIKRFDISVKDVPANAFLMGLVKDTDRNMIVSPLVSGSVTLDLKNVTVEDVLEILHDSYGYRFRRTSYGYEVLPPGLETRVFTVNYLNVNRTGKSNTSISSGQITQSIGQNSQGTVPGSSVETSSESDFWKSLATTLIAIVGQQRGHQVIVNPQAGTIMVKAFPEQLKEVAKYLDSLQSIMTRQVILEAKILEVELSKGFESGVDWTLFELSQESIAKEFTNNLPVFPNIFALNARKGTDFSALIHLLSTQGNVQVLSSPRISTLNNQKAVIKVGRDEFFITDVSSTTTSTGDDLDRTQDVDFTPFFSGIALDVTPEIDANNNVILHIHPFISEVKDQSKEYILNDKKQTIPLALSDIRESDNIVHAHDGQIIIIGGLIRSKTSEQVGSTPAVGKIPLIGSLFRRTSQQSIKSELIILLRPVIVKNDTWMKQIARSAKQFRELDQGFHLGDHPNTFGNLGEFQKN